VLTFNSTREYNLLAGASMTDKSGNVISSSVTKQAFTISVTGTAQNPTTQTTTTAISVGVKQGDKVAYGFSTQGNLQTIPSLALFGSLKSSELQVTSVSGNVINTAIITTLQNETKITRADKLEVGSGFTFMFIIPAGLNRGDLVGRMGPLSLIVNDTRTERWLGVERTVCYAARLVSEGGQTLNVTGHYDRETGIAFSFFVGFRSSAGPISLTVTIMSASMISVPTNPQTTIWGLSVIALPVVGIIGLIAFVVIRQRKGRRTSGTATEGLASKPSPAPVPTAEGTAFCTHCGSRVPVTARFCESCGSKQD
jgi:hypothetical protein